jgi:hypothetical protein
VEDPDPPAVPRFVKKSDPLNIQETGIDAVPEGDFILLQWYGNTEEDLDGYLIYRSDSLGGDFNKIKTKLLSDISPALADTEYLDKDVEIGTRYYYYLKALDHAGNLSDPSDTISYRLVPKPLLISPDENESVSRTPLFQWKFTSSFDYVVAQYVIRVVNSLTGVTVWIKDITRQNYSGVVEEIRYNQDGTALEDTLITGNFYKWRIDALGARDNGTEYEG